VQKLKSNDGESITKKPKYGPGSEIHEKMKEKEPPKYDEECGEVCFSCGS